MPHNICIFEDKKFSNFFPLSLSQPVFDLRIGLETLRSRLQYQFADVSFVVLCRDYLAPIVEVKNPTVRINDVPEEETLFLNGRLLCYGDELKELMDKLPLNGIAVKGGFVVAARLEKGAAGDFAAYIRHRISEGAIEKLCEELKQYAAGEGDDQTRKKVKRKIRSTEAGEGSYEDETLIGHDSLEEKVPLKLKEIVERNDMNLVEIPEARLLSFPWQLIDENAGVITDDFERLPFRGQSEESVVYPGVQMINEDNIVIGEGSTIKSGVVLDATDGPIVIGDDTLVMPNASIIGPACAGHGCIIKTGAKILPGTSIGNVCKIGGEVEGTIFGAYTNKQHDGFIGHSYLGEWVNIGAASNNSDLKNNYSSIRMWCAGQIRETGRQFLGLIMGDHTKTGINTMFNTGTVVGFNCNIYGSEIPNKLVPSFSWGHGKEMDRYDLTKALQTAQVVLERRKVKFEKAHSDLFKHIHGLSERCDRNL